MNSDESLRIHTPFYLALSRLLDFPSPELIEDAARIVDCIRDDPILGAKQRSAGAAAAERLLGRPLLDLQELYTRTFDLDAKHSLCLLHHLVNEQDRSKGHLMADLVAFYREHGYDYVAKELPDYLPAMLEFAAVLEPTEATGFLRQAREAVVDLRANLQKAANPYGALMTLLVQRLDLHESKEILKLKRECVS